MILLRYTDKEKWDEIHMILLGYTKRNEMKFTWSCLDTQREMRWNSHDLAWIHRQREMRWNSHDIAWIHRQREIRWLKWDEIHMILLRYTKRNEMKFTWSCLDTQTKRNEMKFTWSWLDTQTKKRANLLRSWLGPSWEFPGRPWTGRASWRCSDSWRGWAAVRGWSGCTWRCRCSPSAHWTRATRMPGLEVH